MAAQGLPSAAGEEGTAAARRLLHQMPFAAALLDADGIVLAANAAFEGLVARGVAQSPPKLEDVFDADSARHVIYDLDLLRDTSGKGGGRVAGRAYLCCGRGSAEWSAVPFGDAGQALLQLAPASDDLRETRHLRILEDTSGTGSWEFNLQSGRLSWSAQTFRLHGLDPASPPPDVEAAITFYLPWSRDRLEAAFAELVTHRIPYDLELQIRTAEGAIRWIQTRGAAVGDAGEVTHVYGTFRDVTEERQARLHHRRIRAIVESTRNTAFYTAPDATILWVNDAFVANTGFTPEDAIGRLPRDLFGTSEIDPEADGRIRRAMDRREGVATEVRHTYKDGKLRWIALDVQPVFDEGGEHTGFISVQTDITDLKDTEDALRQAEAGVKLARAQLLDAVQSLSDGFALYDADDRLVVCNDSFRELYDEAAPKLTPGERFEDIIRYALHHGQYPEAVGREEAWLTERLAAHRSGDAVFEKQLSSGRWLHVIERETRGGGRVGLYIDVTDRKIHAAALERANHELRSALDARDAAEQRFRDIAALSNDWFWETDRDHKFSYLSEGFTTCFGADGANFIGRTFQGLIEAGSQQEDSASWAALATQFEQREPLRDFVYKAQRGGDPLWIRLRGAPFFDQDGRYLGMRGVATDVTALYSEVLRAESASRAKSRFLAVMSHEIRTPLNGLLGIADALADCAMPADQKSMVSTIRQSGFALLTVLNDVLDLSKIEAGRLDLETTRFRVAELGGQLERLHRPGAERKGLTFTVVVDRGADKPALGDPYRILQIANNLVSNALKFTDRGHVEVRFSRTEPDALILNVVDSGLGMDSGQVDRIFEDFVQAERSTSRNFGGTGLGMSIVRKLVDAMSGWISLKSEPGKGTSVRVEFPGLLVPGAASAHPGDQEQVAPFRPFRALVADDAAANRFVMEKLLTAAGGEVRTVANGAAALAAAEATDFDVFLFDITMPGMSGVELLNAVRDLERRLGRRPTPSLAVTGHSGADATLACEEAGFEAIIAKPVFRNRLLDALSPFLAEPQDHDPRA
ncbi:MAG: PAS domain S-box protein [Pseudomonadota bacterium]